LRNHKRACATVALAIVGIALLGRFFTTEIRFPGDPTVMLAVRATPDWRNHTVLGGRESMRHHFVLVADENDYIGSEMYAAFTKWGWLVMIAGALGACALVVRNPARGR
jgi:hypothetical protein